MVYIPILSSTFPEARPGPYATGYATLRLPAYAPYDAPEPMLKNTTSEDGKPVSALRITENVCALYYPTAPRRAWFGTPSEPWLPDTSADAVEGYSKFLQDRMNKVFWWFAKKIMARARIPVTSHAPIAARDTPFPLVIFSHGLAGTRNTYSQFCSSLASEGYVVLAVEHADGSGPAVIRDGKPMTFRLFAETEWSIPPPDSTTPPPELMDFRGRQLDFRMREVYDAYASFSRLMSASEGDSITDSVKVDGLTSPGWFISSLRRHVDVDNLQLTGHSFGGATIKRMLCSETPAPYTPLPAKHAVLLDPWGEPEVLGHAPLLPPPANPPPPSVMINSQFWTELKYWPGMLTMCQEHGIALCTVVGLEHQGFSDFPLLTSNKSARAFHATIHTLTMNCLTDSLPKCVHFGGPADGGDITFHDGKLQEGKKGDVLVHLKHKCD